jgi:hypothetical protein
MGVPSRLTRDPAAERFRQGDSDLSGRAFQGEADARWQFRGHPFERDYAHGGSGFHYLGVGSKQPVAAAHERHDQLAAVRLHCRR